MAFHRISQRNLPVALVGSGLPQLPRLLREAKPYAERLFQYRDLGRLPDSAARGALITPAQRIGVHYDEPAARQIITECGGHPHFIQEYGRGLWREIETPPITLAEFLSVRDLILDELDQRFFRDRFESATDAEQRYLSIMAQIPEPPYRSAEVVKSGYRVSSSASDPRAGLLRKDLIWSPRRGQVDFTVPHFADYIRRNHARAISRTDSGSLSRNISYLR